MSVTCDKIQISVTNEDFYDVILSQNFEWNHSIGCCVCCSQILPILCFFMSVTTLLYHVGALQRVVGGVGRALAWALDTSHAEAFVAVADVFLGPVGIWSH